MSRRCFLVAVVLAAGAAAGQETDRHAALERAYAELVAARQALRRAEAERELGIEPAPGERLASSAAARDLRPNTGRARSASRKTSRSRTSASTRRSRAGTSCVEAVAVPVPAWNVIVTTESGRPRFGEECGVALLPRALRERYPVRCHALTQTGWAQKNPPPLRKAGWQRCRPASFRHPGGLSVVSIRRGADRKHRILCPLEQAHSSVRVSCSF
jgi:hypothetical protein